MVRRQLERFLGEEVRVTLFDGDEIEGKLHKTGEECFRNNPNLYLPRNYYFLIADGKVAGCLFRSSHVKKCERV